MLIENSIYRNSYVANGTSTEFTISFPFLDASHIIVYKNIDGVESVVEANEYSVAGAGDEHGGTITFTSAPSKDTIIVIARNVPLTQLYKYTELDNFPAESHENALAKLIMIDQQQQDSLNRAIKLAETDTRTPEEFVTSLFAVESASFENANKACRCATEADTSRNETLQFRNEAESILNNTISEGEKAVANVQAQEASSILAVKNQENVSVTSVTNEGNAQVVRLIEQASSILISGTAYNTDVTVDVSSGISAGSNIVLPLDSNGNQLKYRVGAFSIRVASNGYILYNGKDFEEVGLKGSLSSTIKTNIDIEPGTRLNFFILSQNVTVIVDEESGLTVTDTMTLSARPLKEIADSAVKTVNGDAPDETGNVVIIACPLGSVIAFSGQFGGEGNRYPIPTGGSEPDTTWVLCDGGSDGKGGTVPDLRGRMILGASDARALGETGGTEDHCHGVVGTSDDTTLTVAQMPSHTHTSGGPASKKVYHEALSYSYACVNTYTSATGGSEAHSHGVNITSQYAYNLPPYYVLSYIIRVA